MVVARHRSAPGLAGGLHTTRAGVNAVAIERLLQRLRDSDRCGRGHRATRATDVGTLMVTQRLS